MVLVLVDFVVGNTNVKGILFYPKLGRIVVLPEDDK